MKQYALYILFFILGFVFSSLTQCDRETENTGLDRNKLAETYTALNHANKEKELYKKQAESKDKAYKELEKKKSKVVYRTKFDTLATIDTVVVELIKCDSVAKISDTMIDNRNEKIQALVNALNACDTAQVIQSEIIESKDKDLKATKKALRKEKRKLFFTRIGIVAGGILLIFALAQ